MNEQKFKTWLGSYIVGMNLFIIVWVFVLWKIGGFDTDQFTTLLAVVTPMFSCYASVVFHHLKKKRHKTKSTNLIQEEIPIELGMFSFVIPTLFFTIISMVIYFQAKGTVFANFEQFKRLLLFLEATFSLYLGKTIYDLFPRLDND